MTASDIDWPASPLDAADAAFAALTCDPAPMTLDLDTFDPGTGLPCPAALPLTARAASAPPPRPW
ncbi:hypothetical protein [Micromonospora sp. ATA51]|uniref:hypothetical protein n=1 Tax=Micromonospora sp. ATA51 TaxID=2806098 RepID=UPI001A3E8FCD|nr:hypothetical protein [Micromonospora sp. ATA51]MBM0224414.1 hypothetical protein [Micromonospora sp. ATA51]